MDIVDALLGEHAVLADQCRRLARAVSAARDVHTVRAHARALGAAVRGHSTLEDDLLLAPLELVLGSDDLALTYMRMVHAWIDRGLAEVDEASHLERARTRLLEVVEMIRGHFREEEHALFPLADRSLAAEERVRSGAVWKAGHGMG